MTTKIEGKGIVVCMLSVTVAAALMISGCGRSEKTHTLSTPDGKVTVKTDESGKGGTFQIEGKDGKAIVVTGQEGGTITEAQLGIPVYPGATVKGTVKMEDNTAGNKGKVEMHTLTTADNFEKVSDFYKSNLKNAKSTFIQGSGDKGMAMFSAGDKGEISVTVVGEGQNGTSIQVAKKTK